MVCQGPNPGSSKVQVPSQDSTLQIQARPQTFRASIRQCGLGVATPPPLNVRVCRLVEWRPGCLERQRATVNRVIDCKG